MNGVCAGVVGRLSVTSNVRPAATQSFHPNEPDGPSVRTSVPGPKSLQRLADLSHIQVTH